MRKEPAVGIRLRPIGGRGVHRFFLHDPAGHHQPGGELLLFLAEGVALGVERLNGLAAAFDFGWGRRGGAGRRGGGFQRCDAGAGGIAFRAHGGELACMLRIEERRG